MATLIERRTALFNEAKSIALQAKAAGRDMTNTEIQDFNAKAEQVKELDTKIKAAAEAERLLKSLGSPADDHPEVKTAAPSGKRFLAKGGVRKTGQKIADGIHSKALLAAGVTPVTTELFGGSPVQEPGEVPTVSNIIPRETIDGSRYTYLRQSTRDHQAAVVAPGALKPTSRYEFSEVEGEQAVIAHLSEGINTYWTVDRPELVGTVADELLYGLLDAEERLLISGNGTGGNPTGLLNTSGAQTQAFATDMLTTARKALTAVETLRYQAGTFVLNPVDWETIELARNASGDLEFAEGPVNRAEKKLWGTQVATSTYVPAGTGLLLANDSVHLINDRAIRVETSNANGDDFARNLVRIRAEFRTAVAVTRPMGIVKLNLTAA